MECNTAGAVVHEIGDEHVQSLRELLRRVPDHRQQRGRRYEAATVLVILLLAKLAGECTLSGIAHWARLREPWLKAVLGLKRLPCANTYAYVCAHLDVAELTAQVRKWLAQVAPKPPADALVQWAIDGKVLRGSHRSTPTPQSGQEVLNVYEVETGMLQHCQMIASKGYEAATAAAFVGQTKCEGVVITADALHTRPRFCRSIRKQKGHYLFIVKGNRAELEAEIRYLFALPPHPHYPVQTARTVEPGHGRLIIRQIWTSSELNLALKQEWCDVAQVFVLERRGTRNGKPVYESVCGLTSLPPALASPAQLLALVQQHWRIENRCHWRRDVTLREDACTVRHPLVATILAVLNTAILALLDHCQVTNARTAMRTFAAFPEQALALLTQPL
jgi:predicted transposase YbfD/YdcC